MAKYDSWKKKDLENAKVVVAEFERRLNTEVRQQERIDIEKEQDFRRKELLEKYMSDI